MNIEMWLSGFFFLFIIITNFASNYFGYKTFGDVDINAQLQEINKDPKKFKISVVVILVEHLGIRHTLRGNGMMRHFPAHRNRNLTTELCQKIFP